MAFIPFVPQYLMTLFKLLVCVAWITCSVCRAQAAADSPAVDPSLNLSPADVEWQSIRSFHRPRPPASPAPTDPAARAAARKQAAAEFIAQADRLKAFYTQHPTHQGAREARHIEALLLFYAAQSGDASQDARREELVQAIRADAKVPAAQRAEITAWSRNWEIRQQRDLEPMARLERYETIARGLIAEFPDVPDAYESLFNIGRSLGDERGRQIAEELQAMPAPAAVKARARELLDRHALQGKSLADVSKAALGEDSALERARGRATVIYSWASWSPGSIALAKQILATAPPGAAIIGVSLDSDVDAASALAGSEGLPGERVYDSRGREGALAQQLKLSDPGLVYTTDAGGVISSVAAGRELARSRSNPSLR